VPHPPLLAEVWREQAGWSRAADRMKDGIARARIAALVIVVLVAVFGTTAAALGEALHPLGRWLAALAAVGSVSLPPLRKLWSGTRLQNWTRARSVSEAMKADVYLWLARVRPFTDDADAAKLRERIDRLRADAADLASAAERGTPTARDLPAVHDLATYFDIRVGGQYAEYYRPRVRAIERRLGWFRAVGFVLGAIGAVLGGAAVLLATSFAAWIAVVSTVATAVAVHVSATRYEFQRIEFARTAEELRRIKTRAEQPGVAEQELHRLARRAERVISIENQGWMAKLAEDPADQKAPG
jgi:SMODS and SLOG-associating 2TM effector domain 1/Protein of unknown function (DUF4231)